VSGQLPWYVARSSGLVSWGLLAASVLWGLALSTKILGRNPRPNWILDLHRWLGGLALVFLTVHVVALLGDQYVHFGVVDVALPMATSWHPGRVAWGVVGMYLLIAVEITSLLRSRIPRAIWRRTHYLSFPLFVVATIHGLEAGTDTKRQLARVTAIVVASVVAGLTVARIFERQPANSQDRVPRP
jgi:predicted ferric reductase